MKLNTTQLKAVLEEKGWSGYKLAEVLGVKPQGVYALLKGQGNVTLQTVDKLARALEVDGVTLLTE